MHPHRASPRLDLEPVSSVRALRNGVLIGSAFIVEGLTFLRTRIKPQRRYAHRLTSPKGTL